MKYTSKKHKQISKILQELDNLCHDNIVQLIDSDNDVIILNDFHIDAYMCEFSKYLNRYCFYDTIEDGKPIFDDELESTLNDYKVYVLPKNEGVSFMDFGKTKVNKQQIISVVKINNGVVAESESFNVDNVEQAEDLFRIHCESLDIDEEDIEIGIEDGYAETLNGDSSVCITWSYLT